MYRILGIPSDIDLLVNNLESVEDNIDSVYINFEKDSVINEIDNDNGDIFSVNEPKKSQVR